MAEIRSDAELVTASATQPSLFADVFDRHFDVIHRYLARRVGRQLADDLAAETFLQAFKARARYDPAHGDARPWLYGIAANLLRHHYREERRRLMAYARTGVDPLADDLGDADSRADAQALGPRLALALASLPARDREPLLLLAWGQLSYEEIARALRVPVGTVRSRLHRARRHVNELVGDPGQYLIEDELGPRPASEG